MPTPRVICALVLTLFPLLAAAPARGARPIQAVYEPLEIYADTLAKRQSKARAHAWADSVGRGAALRGDRALAAAVDLWHGRRYGAFDSEYERAAPYFDAALTAARALKDTFAIATVFNQRGLTAQLTGRTASARSDYKEAVRYGRRARLTTQEGLGHRGLGALAKLAGEYDVAWRELDAAVRLLPEASFHHLHSRLLLGEMLQRTGRPDEARERFLDVQAEGWKRRNRWMIAASLQDLGIVAFEQGDMAEADRNWAQAAAHFDTLATRGSVDKGSAIMARINRAHALTVLGRLDEAEALLGRLLDESAQAADPATRVATLSKLGALLRRAGRLDRAERTLRAVRAATDGTDASEEEDASIELAGLLRETGRLAEAGALLDSLLVPGRRARMTAISTSSALTEQSRLLRARGRAGEALASAREGERATRTLGKEPSITWLDAVVELARCQRNAGRPDDAVATLARAARAWEKWRSRISNFEWRERAGSGHASLFAEYGLALLDTRRAVPAAARARGVRRAAILPGAHARGAYARGRARGPCDDEARVRRLAEPAHPAPG